MQACRDDGVLLRPSWPATAIEYSFAASFDSLEPIYLWAARSYIDGKDKNESYSGGGGGGEKGESEGGMQYIYTYLLSINSNEERQVPLAELLAAPGLNHATAAAAAAAGFSSPAGSAGTGADYGATSVTSAGGWAIVERWHGLRRGMVRTVTSDPATAMITIPATPGINLFKAGHSLWFIAPLLQSGFAFLGEADKIVKASFRRVVAITASSDLGGGLTAEVLLARGETAEFAVLVPASAPAAVAAADEMQRMAANSTAKSRIIVVTVASCLLDAGGGGNSGGAARIVFVTCNASTVAAARHVTQPPFGDVDVPMVLQASRDSHTTAEGNHEQGGWSFECSG